MMNVMYKYFGVVGLWFLTQSAMAIQLPPLIEMNCLESNVTLPVKNTGEVDMSFRLTAQETTFPILGYQVLDSEASGLNISPSSVTLKPGQEYAFHIVVKDKVKYERYFHLSVSERPELKEINSMNARANGNIDFPLQVDSNLIVRPIRPEFSYEIKTRRFHNLSNGYVVLMQDGDCGKARGQTQVVAQNQWADLAPKNGRLVISAGMADQIKVIENQCL